MLTAFSKMELSVVIKTVLQHLHLTSHIHVPLFDVSKCVPINIKVLGNGHTF